ncbi:MAG: restriction endonuclease [Cellvibrionaceae bacterium]
MNSFNDPASKFKYLRSKNVTPYVFEEMVLTALKRCGANITRNKRYTGDGGIDGKAVIEKKECFIQSKNYSAHISHAHVLEFSKICYRKNKIGLFVHTGKTGKKIVNDRRFSNVRLISGKRLLILFDGSNLKLSV